MTCVSVVPGPRADRHPDQAQRRTSGRAPARRWLLGQRVPHASGRGALWAGCQGDRSTRRLRRCDGPGRGAVRSDEEGAGVERRLSKGLRRAFLIPGRRVREKLVDDALFSCLQMKVKLPAEAEGAHLISSPHHA